jgi:hypothetical protein
MAVIVRWVTKKILFRAPPCFGRHVKPLVPAAFAVVSIHHPALGPRGGLTGGDINRLVGYGPFSLCEIHK